MFYTTIQQQFTGWVVYKIITSGGQAALSPVGWLAIGKYSSTFSLIAVETSFWEMWGKKPFHG